MAAESARATSDWSGLNTPSGYTDQPSNASRATAAP
jgi:hypothetical protein